MFADVDTKEKEVLCEWEAVLHKETSEYYYWNRVTGETTWEKPSAYAASEVLKRSDLQVNLEEDSKRTLEDPHSRSKPVEVAVSTINFEAKDDESLYRLIVGSVDQSKDGGSEGNQDAGRDNEDGKETDISLEIKETFEKIDSPSENAVKSCSDAQGDVEGSASAAVIEYGAGESRHVEESTTLNIVEDGEGVEDPGVESTVSGGVKDLSTTVGSTGLENADPKNIMEETRRYDHHRLLERGEVLAEKFKILAG